MAHEQGTFIKKKIQSAIDPLALPATLLCFSHLRWDFVYQRPQHLLSRFAKSSNVVVFEEPYFDSENPYLELAERDGNVTLAIPHLPGNLSDTEREAALAALLNGLVKSYDLNDCMFWYYTPMALSFSSHLKPAVTVYDCMDELSAFAFAPPRLKALEAELFDRADVVFTGGYSLYRAKKDAHANVHPFPSSIDRAHFAKARLEQQEPEDQKNIPHPRLGFYGVVDERFDIEMLRQSAQARPEWQFVIIGPVVKIDPASLPQGSNIHYLGGKSYQELPGYLSGWDVALIPFAINESTKYISPTKTPEYLAAGIPVVSTPITDVVNPYGRQGLVHIAGEADVLVSIVDSLLQDSEEDRALWLRQVDAFLASNSWDLTQKKMVQQITMVLQKKRNTVSSSRA